MATTARPKTFRLNFMVCSYRMAAAWGGRRLRALENYLQCGPH
jgi:hypothetical protein